MKTKEQETVRKDNGAQALTTEAQFKRLPFKELEPDGTNDREFSGYDAKQMGELKASITQDGVILPLIVYPRADGKGYHVSAGERRWTAVGELLEKGLKKTAGGLSLTELPCMIYKDASDATVAKRLQLIENMQRSQLHGLEEARGLAQLHTTLSVKEIADSLGKSEAYVHARIKLLRAPKEVQDAAIAGHVNESVLLLLSRIPSEKLQIKALQEVIDPDKLGMDSEFREPLSFRHAKQHIQNSYMIRLKGSPFDQEDETLVPVVWRVSRGAGESGGARVKGRAGEITVTSVREPGVTRSGTAQAILEGEDWFVIDPVTDPAHPEKKTISTKGALLGPVDKKTAEAYAAFLTCTPAPALTFSVERTCGGRCSDCPFRTGNLSKLAPDLKKADGPDGGSADVCTLPTCYKQKKENTFKRKAEKEKDKGNTLLKPGQSAKLFSYMGDKLDTRDYIDLKAECPVDPKVESSRCDDSGAPSRAGKKGKSAKKAKRRTWEEVLGTAVPETGLTVALNPRTEKRHLLLDVPTLLEVAKKAGLKLEGKVEANGKEETWQEQNARQTREREENSAPKRAVLADVITELVAGAKKVKSNAEFWRWLLGTTDCDRYMKDCAPLFGYKNAKEFEKKADETELRALYLLTRASQNIDYAGDWSDSFAALCEFTGVDLKAFEKKGAELVKAQQAEAGRAVAAAPPPETIAKEDKEVETL